MIRRAPGLPREHDDWLDELKPAWTILEPERLDALRNETPFEGSALRLEINMTKDEIARLPMVCNALVQLRTVAEGNGLRLTARVAQRGLFTPQSQMASIGQCADRRRTHAPNNPPPPVQAVTPCQP